MINEIILNKIVDGAIGEKILLHKSKCLRKSNFKDKCQSCFESCPEDAISLENNSISINNLLCTGCGKCISTCPTASLSFAKNAYTAAYLRVMHTDESVWGCIKSNRNSDINFGCTRMIDNVFLEALKTSNLSHSIVLDFTNCETCEYKKYGMLDEAFTTVEDSKIRINLDKESNSVDMSRREFLKGIFDKGNEYKDATIDDISESFNSLRGKEKYSENLDEINTKLLEAFSELHESLDTSVIYNLDFNEKCTFCRKCISYCPHGAIFSEKNEEQEVIYYDTTKCTFCTLCIDKCEFDAIDKVIYNNIGNIKLVEAKLKKCSICNFISTAINSEGLCESCTIREQNRKKFNLHRRKKRD